ncbi:MAG: hypothetical protein ABR520_06995 [Mycobacteriales bacterium]|nr:hypothetical protein [Frankia sp.]
MAGIVTERTIAARAVGAALLVASGEAAPRRGVVHAWAPQRKPAAYVVRLAFAHAGESLSGVLLLMPSAVAAGAATRARLSAEIPHSSGVAPLVWQRLIEDYLDDLAARVEARADAA